ncbi:MAG: potassium channel family protein [Bacteroidetes bacterium]|nr:potassium channel family protein [Bacteroidota bacterium]
MKAKLSAAKAKKRLEVLRTLTIWNSVLLVSLVFVSFILPVLPVPWQKHLFRIAYSVIYISAYFSLYKKPKYLLILLVVVFLLEWISGVVGMPVLLAIARTVNVLFFLVMVTSLIIQIARSKDVNPGVILDSIVGYLLLGLIFAIFITLILQHDPDAYNYKQTVEEGLNASIPNYYGYITMTTVGYGDILPLKPYTRSLATFIAISGQLYIAIIIALLVGKFAATRNAGMKNEE